MPRKRRKKKGKIAGPRSNEHRVLAEFWTNRIQAGLKKQEEYRNTRLEVLEYLGTDHSSLFDDFTTRELVVDVEGSAAVSVPKVAQMRNTLGPRLSYTKPHRNVIPVSEDGVINGLAKVLEEYLAYTARECKLAKQIRRSINEGLIGGRAFLQLIWDDVRELVTSKHLRSVDVVIDPDFDDIEDAKWIAIRQRKPYWEIERGTRAKEKWRLKDLHKRTAVERWESDEARTEKDEDLATCDMVVYWVVYSKMGRGWRGAELEDESLAKRRDDRQDFVRLEIVERHDKPLAEGKWDVPLYLDKEWPLSYTDFLDPVDSQWPQSMSGQVLPSQKVIDLLSTARFSSCKTRDRSLILIKGDKVPEIAQRRIKSGGMAEFIPIECRQGQALQDTIHVVDLGSGSPESAAERQFHIDQIEMTTGASPMLMGAQEQSAQDRSATATQARASGADARIADLQSRVEELATDAARKEALTIRLALDVEEVAPYVRTGKIGMFYISIEVAEGAEIPVRDLDDSEDAPLSLNKISPSASTYFDAPEEAIEAAFRLWEDMQMSEDPEVYELAMQLQARGVDEPELGGDGLPLAIEIRPVTVERVWADTAGMTPKELSREFGYEIASGSALKIDKSQEQASADEMVQTAMPAALGMGDVDAANQIMEIRDDAYDKPEGKRVRFQPPPPPMPAGGEGPPQQEAA